MLARICHGSLQSRARRFAPLRAVFRCSGSRVRLPLLAYLRFGYVNTQSVVLVASAARSGQHPVA
jgi:hypothetical protein